MRPITRDEALRTGLSRYFTGKPCARGHVCERWAQTRVCLKCGNIASNKFRKNKRNNNPAWRKFNDGRVNSYRKNKRATDPEWKAKRDAKSRACYARAVAADPTTYRVKWRNQRAVKRNVIGVYSIKDVKKLLDRQNFKCLCGVKFSAVAYTIDHIIPLSRGGLNWPDNLQLLCQPCNDSKGAKLMSEWRPRWQSAKKRTNG